MSRGDKIIPSKHLFKNIAFIKRHFKFIEKIKIFGLKCSFFVMFFLVFDVFTAPKNDFAGEIGAAKNRGSLTLGYTTGPWAINTQFTFIGKSYVDDQILATLCADDPSVCAVPAAPRSAGFGAKTYMDAQLSFTQGKVQYYFGIDNLFDTKAPRIDTNNVFGIGSFGGSNSTGTGTVADVYDAIGRRYYVGLRASF